MSFSRPATAALRAASLRSVAPRSVRGYAAAAAQDTRPPVALYGIDGTYASALYTAAAKSSSLDPVSKALQSLGEVFKKDPKLSTILQAPTLTADDKSQIIAELQKHTGGADKANTVKNFLETLAENNRLGILPGVVDKFETLIGASKGEVEMTVTSAQELDKKTIQRLEAAVGKSEFSQGKKLKVTQKVNQDIVGGLIVEVGDRTIDLSVSAKIAKMNKLLTDSL